MPSDIRKYAVHRNIDLLDDTAGSDSQNCRSGSIFIDSQKTRIGNRSDGISCKSILEILLLGIGLSMDAFAVSICKGLSTKKLQIKHYLVIGAWFGGFQALMPTIGYFLGSTFEQYITAFDHWVAFVLLAAIGANMIKESFSKEESETNSSFAFKTMLLMALATSIDALAVGITFALLPDVNVPLAVCLIGVTTFVCSAAGLKVGNLFGLRYKTKAELAGGIILILIGLKILLEHLGVISF